MTQAVLFLLLVRLGYLSCYAYRLDSSIKSFTTAIKDGQTIAGVEQTLFESEPGKAGVITEQWSGGGAYYNADTVIAIYVDGESTPSIQYKLLLAHGMGFSADDESNVIHNNGPFGTRYISHEADSGGLSHRYVIPFTKSVRVTGTSSVNGTFWYWMHGVYNFPVIVTDFNLELPTDAKLRLYKQENVDIQPLEFLTLASVNNSAGLILGFTLAANSSAFGYLEGCMRMKIDNEEMQFLSSGTEDIFESSYYFDAGIYHDDQVGLTYKESPGTMSAYKFFNADPMIFTQSMSLIWRSGETSGVHNQNGCPNVWSNSTSIGEKRQLPRYDPLKAQPATVTTYTWVYLYGTEFQYD